MQEGNVRTGINIDSPALAIPLGNILQNIHQIYRKID